MRNPTMAIWKNHKTRVTVNVSLNLLAVGIFYYWMDIRFDITGPYLGFYLDAFLQLLSWPMPNLSQIVFIILVLNLVVAYHSLRKLMKYFGVRYVVFSIFWILASTVPAYLFVLNQYNHRHEIGTGSLFIFSLPWDFAMWEIKIPLFFGAGQLLALFVFNFSLLFGAPTPSKPDQPEKE